MITTLRTGALTLSNVQYKFDASGRLTIKLTTSGNHLLYGDVNITLANVKDIGIYDENRSLIPNFFNNTFSFSRTGADTLEYYITIKSGIDQADLLATLPNNGSAITATVANSSFQLESGTYNFALLDTADTVFSTSRVGINLVDVGGSGVDGVQAEYDELGDTVDYLSINDQDLTFNYDAEVSIVADVSGTTNIPLVITKL